MAFPQVVKLSVTGARGESFADVARRTGQIGTTGPAISPSDSDAAILEKFWQASNGSAILAAKAEIKDLAAKAADAPSVLAKLNKVSTTVDLASVLPGVGIVRVIDFDADYVWSSSSTATSNGYTVVAPIGGGTGRWLLSSDGVTLSPRGGGLSDAANLNAAGLALAAYGAKLRLRSGTYRVDAVWSFPTLAGLVVEMQPGTVILGLLDSSNNSPANAVIYAAPDAFSSSTTVAVANVRTTTQIRVAASVGVGKMIRVRDTASGGGFRGNRYMVKAQSFSSGSYLLTLDRPVLTTFGIGDVVDIWNERRAFGHRIIGNGATVTGGAGRLLEFICVEDCIVEGLRFLPIDVSAACVSFDIAGHRNRFENCLVDASANANIALEHGMMIETQEGTTCHGNLIANVPSTGIRLLNCENCNVTDNEATGCLVGCVVWGEGGNFLGSRGTRVVGNRFNGNAEGIAVGIGSSNTLIESDALYNGTNLTIGGGGGNVTKTTVQGSFAGASLIGVTVVDSALDTTFVSIDTSDSPIGMNVQGAAVSIDTWSHRGNASNYVLGNAGGLVSVDRLDVNIGTIGTNVLRTEGAGKTRISSGTIAAIGDSNLFHAANTAEVTIGPNVRLSATGVSANGGYAETGATITALPGADFALVATALAGPGTKIMWQNWARRLYLAIASVGTTAETTEQTLASFNLPGNTLRAGQVVTLRAWGTCAANANGKTLGVKIGGTALISQAVAGAWQIVADFIAIDASNVEYLVNAAGGAVNGAQALALASDQAIVVTGTNAVAAANDIVLRGVEITHRSGLS